MTWGELLNERMERAHAFVRDHAYTPLILFGFIFLVFLCAGVYLIRYSWTGRKDARASVDWPTVEGKIILCRHSQPRENAPPGRIEYVYTVDGISHSSDVVVFGQAYRDDHYRRYPAGTRVTVTYDPDDVTNAVLEPGEFNNYAPFYLGGMILLACGCVVLYGACQMVRTVFRALRKQSGIRRQYQGNSGRGQR